MGTAEALLTRLNPKTTCWTGGGGGEVITQEDVAGALAGTSYIQESILRYKYLGDTSLRRWLVQWLTAAVMSEADHWRACSFSQKQALAEIVLMECVPECRCERCKGRGSIPDEGGLLYSCPFCGGRGWAMLRAKDKATRLGVEPRNYRGTWKARERVLVAKFLDEERKGIEIVNRGLRV